MYSLYLDGMLLPVTPSKIEMQTGGKSRLVTLISGAQASIPCGPELKEISFTALLPQAPYPFAQYEEGFRPADAFLERIEELKEGKKPFRFILSRWTPAQGRLFDTNLSVTMEEYSVNESAGNGFDIEVKILLRQYRPLKLQEIELDAEISGAPVILEENRTVDSEPGRTGSSSSGGKGVSTPYDGTKEAKAVAERSEKASKNLAAASASISALSQLLSGKSSANSGGGSGSKVMLVSRR